MNNEAGKGDRYRIVDREKWDRNYDRIFKKKNNLRKGKEKRRNKNIHIEIDNREQNKPINKGE